MNTTTRNPAASVGIPSRALRTLVTLVALAAAVVGSALLATILVPHDTARSLADALALDGSVDGFTVERWNRLQRFGAASGVVVLLLAFATFWQRRRLAAAAARASGSLRRSLRLLAADTAAGIGHIGRRHLLALAALTAAALALRLTLLFEPIRYDEAFTVRYFAAKPFHVALTDYSAPNNHLLHTALVRIVYLLLGPEPWAIRLPALAAGLALIPLVYAATRLFAGRRAAIAAAALLAVSPQMVLYSVNARGYTLMCMFFLLLVLLGHYWARTGSAAALVLSVLAATAGLYAIPIMLFPLGAIALWLLAPWFAAGSFHEWWRTRRTLLLAGAATAGLTTLLYLPVIIVNGWDALVANPAVVPLPWNEFLTRFPPLVANTWRMWHSGVPLPGRLALGVAAAIGLAACFRPHRRELRFLLVGAVLWSLLILAIQQRSPAPRGWIFLLPLYLVVIATGLAAAGERLAARLRTAPALLVGAPALALALLSLPGSTRNARQLVVTDPSTYADAAPVISFVRARIRPGDRVIAGIPANEPIHYHLFVDRATGRSAYSPPDPDSIRRVIAVVEPLRGQTVAALLQRLPHPGSFTAPRLIGDIGRTEIYEVLRRDAK